MEIIKIAVWSMLAHVKNEEVNPGDVEIESFWFEPDGYWRAVVVHKGGFVRVRGSIGELFNGPTVADTKVVENALEPVVKPGEDGKIEITITGKGYEHHPTHTSFNVQTNMGNLEISKRYLHHTLGKDFSEHFANADTMEIKFVNKHGMWAKKE